MSLLDWTRTGAAMQVRLRVLMAKWIERGMEREKGNKQVFSTSLKILLHQQHIHIDNQCRNRKREKKPN